jgi:PKHD-type hydroxylase
LTTDIIPGSNYDFLTRKLSFSIMLNDDYEEGEFFMNLGEKFNVPLKKGDMLIFPSFILHGVNPVKTGTRKSLVGWVTGPKFK